MAASVLQLRPNLSVHPIAPNPIVVLHSEHPLETVEVRPRTTQWDPAPTQLHWKVALSMALAATVVWMACSSIVRQYDVFNGRSFLGDVALTLMLLLAVVVPIWLLRAAS